MPRIAHFGRASFLVMLAAALLVLPFYFGELAFLAFIAFIPLFSSLRNKTSSGIFKRSYFLGILFFGMQCYPLIGVTIAGYLFLVLYLGLYFGFFGLMSAPFLLPQSKTTEIYPKVNLEALIFVPSFWVVLEALRSWIFGGIPLALLAYSQWKNLTLIQIADVLGVFGVSFYIIFINVAIFRLMEIFKSKKENSNRVAFARQDSQKSLGVILSVLLITIAVVWLYGIWKLKEESPNPNSNSPDRLLKVSVLQGNVPQNQKWDNKIKESIFERYKQLLFMSSLDKPDLIVWPETSFPGYLEDEPVMAAKLRSFIRQIGIQTLVGAPTLGNLEHGLRFYNSAVFYDGSGEEKKRYHKLHLVPFGEYVPFEMFFGFVRHLTEIGQFSPGTEYTVFEKKNKFQNKIVTQARFSALICYEDMFPWLVREFCKKNTDFLVNITNDAWFGDTWAPYQHAQASIFRAVENRISVVRAANTGLSCFIAPTGEILSTVDDKGKEIFVTGKKTQSITLRKTLSFYTQYGDLILILCIAFSILAIRESFKRSQYAKF